MEWYWIVLIGLVYFVMWIFTSILISRTGGDEFCVFGGFLWPLILPVAIVMWFVDKFG